MLTNLQIRDIETLVHPYTNLARHREIGPLIIERGAGVYVYDSAGRPYIEGLAGLWCSALGYGNEELVEAAASQMRKLSFSHLFSGRSHDPAIEVAEKLKEIAPFSASKVFFTSSGSEANDTQVKLAWYMNNARGRPRKKKIIARLKGYHGVTIASASLTGLPLNHADFDLPIAGILHTSCPHHYRFARDGESEEEFSTRLARELDEMIEREGPDTVAAFIAEPVMGAGGAIIHPRGYFEAVGAVLAKHDVRLIADEVITAFARTGEMFGSTLVNMRPHSMSLAKAITSAYAPLGAVLIDEEMHEALLDESRKLGAFGHGFTYSGHPVSCAVAAKTLEIYERDDILGQVRKKSPLFLQRLGRLAEHPLIGEARGVGLMGGAEIVRDKASKRQFDAKSFVAQKTAQFAEEEGLIVRALIGDRVAFCPPLIISEAEIAELFDRFERALGKTTEWIARERLGAD